MNNVIQRVVSRSPAPVNSYFVNRNMRDKDMVPLAIKHLYLDYIYLFKIKLVICLLALDASIASISFYVYVFAPVFLFICNEPTCTLRYVNTFLFISTSQS